MTYLIATSTFLDPTDNQPVIAGATVVAPEAAVVRLHPERFRPIERGNLGMLGGGLERVGGVTGFHRAGIRRAHRDAGQEVEAAGWLFGQYRPEPTATGQRWLSPPARSNDPAPAARSI